MLSTLTALSVFENRFAQRAEGTFAVAGDDPVVEAEIDYWRANAPSATSASDLTNDPRLLQFLGQAFGFTDADMPSAILVELALVGGAADPSSGASRNADYRLTEMARTIGFAEFGGVRLRDANVQSILEQRYRAAQSATTAQALPVSRDSIEATYFRDNIAEVTEPADLLSDFRLYAFAMKAFGLDDEISQTAYMQTALGQGADDDSDLAIRRGDRDLIEMISVFGLGEGDTPRTDAPAFADGTIRRFAQRTGADILSDALPVDTSNDSTETTYFRDAIGDVDTVEDLLSDRRLYAYVMTAFDLGDELDSQGLVRASLTEGASDEEAFAQRYSDPRYGNMARALGLAEYGSATLRDPISVQMIVDQYERVAAEEEMAETDPAAAEAAYFNRKASGITSWFSVMADSRLRDVVFTVLELPTALAALDVDRVVKDLADRYDVADFADPEALSDFIARYAALSDANSQFTSAGSGAATILSGQASAGSLYSLIAQL